MPASSFDEYSTEVKSGRLEWSLVHKSDKFWRENASRLNDNNYQLLKILVSVGAGRLDPARGRERGLGGTVPERNSCAEPKYFVIS